MDKIDLHTHTTASDGALSPAELVRRAAAVGIGTLGITDHDTVAGLEEAQVEARPLGIRIVPGVEFGADYRGNEVHMLGYFFDTHDRALLDTLAELREGRFGRARRMLDKLEPLGVSVPWERVLEIAGDAAPGRPHLAQALIEAGYAGTIDEVFEKYLGHGRPGYVERTQLSPRDCVASIHRAGGAASLAHPTWLTDPERLLAELVAAGLDGIETYYGAYDDATIEWLRGLADRYNLVPTGGTDFHGYPGLSHSELGSRFLPPDCLAELERRAEGRRREA